ncbi:MAG: histidinol dehydrogenase, partial [Pseudomonadota bacterium]
MPHFLNANDDGFEAAFAAFLGLKREVSADVDAAVATILNDVRARGDAAVAECTLKFDRLDFSKTPMAVTSDEVDAAVAAIDADTMAALTLARDRIRSHHERQLPKDDAYEDSLGVKLGSRWTAIEAVGLYVPGGTASYPSS